MRTDYKAIHKAFVELDDAALEMNRVASLRIGMISGGPSIDQENEEFYRCLNVAKKLVSDAIANGSRLSRLLAECNGYNRQILGLVKEAIQGKEDTKNYKKYMQR